MVVTSVTMKCAVLCDVTSYYLAEVYRRFGGIQHVLSECQ
jgi:hypothetical protein